MKSEKELLVLSLDHYMEMINNVDDIVLSENPFEYLSRLPAFNMGAYLHISALGDVVADFPKRLYHKNLPEAAISEFEQAVVNRLPPCAKSCFLLKTFSWLTDIVTAPTTSEKDRRALKGYLQQTTEGLCIPIYGPHNSNGYVFIGFNEERSAFSPAMPYQVLSLVQLMHVRFRQIADQRHGRINLSPREEEVLELICLGKTNSEIGTVLNISTSTVSGYVSQIFLKMGVSDRISAAMRKQAMT